MGCGCQKKGNSRRERMIRQRTKLIKTQIKKLKDVPIRVSSMEFITKSTICMSCSESKQSIVERKKGIKICRKTNRLINNIIRDLRFVCPIGKWKKLK